MRIFDSGVYRNMTAEEESAYFESTVPTDEGALTRYANELTGANDTDLISAAETLIEQRIKEES